jgi:hypothetical protein
MTAAGAWGRHLLQGTVDVLDGVSPDIRDDVYVVHLMIWPEDNDMRNIVVDVAWNTRQHLRRQQEEPGAHAFLCEIDPYGFVEPSAVRLGSEAGDGTGADLRRKWLEEAGLWYVEPRAHFINDGLNVWDHMLEIVVGLAQALHEGGHFARIFGHDVPVLINAELGDEELLRQINRDANPDKFFPLLDRWTSRDV